ncbi:DoxX family protein [Actinomyces bowdenii]|nr:DoxX family protein [Actinomyces bowdenii]
MSTTPTPSAPASAVVMSDHIVTRPGARRALAALRLLIGFYFLWAFLDKTFGLSFMTPPDQAWIRGGQPAQGFIIAVTGDGPLAGFFSLFANAAGDVLFMLALLGIGTALMLGMGLKVAALSGTALMFFLWLAEFPPLNVGQATNPIIDTHWVLAAAMIVIALTRAGDTWGLGRWWSRIVGDSWLR